METPICRKQIRAEHNLPADLRPQRADQSTASPDAGALVRPGPMPGTDYRRIMGARQGADLPGHSFPKQSGA